MLLYIPIALFLVCRHVLYLSAVFFTVVLTLLVRSLAICGAALFTFCDRFNFCKNDNGRSNNNNSNNQQLEKQQYKQQYRTKNINHILYSKVEKWATTVANAEHPTASDNNNTKTITNKRTKNKHNNKNQKQ